MKRMISLWLPRFTTDLLCRGQPGWRDRPLVTYRAADNRLTIAAVNRPAGHAGLTPGMALTDARAMLPDLRAIAATPDSAHKALAALADWCGRYSPRVALDMSDPGGGIPVTGAGGIWIDIAGCAHLFGGEDALADDLHARLGAMGFTARLGIAATPGAAWALARFGAPDPIVALPDGVLPAALADLPVAALRLPPALVAALSSLGLRTVGAVLDLPRAALAARFGAALLTRLDQALGRVDEPLIPHIKPPAARVRIAFPEPIGRTEDIEAALAHLMDALAAKLDRAGRGARRLELTLYRAEGTAARLRIGTARPRRDAPHLVRLFDAHLDKIDAGFGIDAMALAAPRTEALAPSQPGLADGRAPAQDDALAGDDIAALIDRLSNRLGRHRVTRVTPHESHLPERAIRARPAIDPELAPPNAAWPADKPFAQPRPPRLLPRPERIEAVAPVPDDPPLLFRWRRVLYRVVHAEGPERIQPEWWVADGAPAGLDDAALSAATRDYYRVEDSAGRRFWLYREGLYRSGADPADGTAAAPAWYLHGLFA